MAGGMRVFDADQQLRAFPVDMPVVRQINAKKAVPFEGFDECFWNPKTNEALSIDDVDVDPAFVRAALIFIPDEEFSADDPKLDEIRQYLKETPALADSRALGYLQYLVARHEERK